MHGTTRGFALLIALVAALQAEDSAPKIVDQIDPGMVSQVKDWTDLVRVVKDRDGGEDILEVEARRVKITSPNWISIDPGKTYSLEGLFRSASCEKPASAYFGLIMYDKDKRPIYLAHVSTHPTTTAELAEAVEAGQKSLVVSRAETWPGVEYGAIAFGAKDDMSDLPNFSTSPQIDGVVRQDGTDKFTVKLKEPLQAAYPAGTQVRLHEPWTQPLFWVANEWVPSTWKKYEVKIGGEASFGAPMNQFWHGTRYVRVFFELGNWDKVPEDGAKLQCQDISFSEL